MDKPADKPADKTEAEIQAEELVDKIMAPDDVSRLLAEKTQTAFNYEDLLLKGYLEQSFAINPKIKVLYRTLSGRVLEHLLRILSNRHRQDWSAVFDELARFFYVAASLQGLNGNAVKPDLEEVCESNDTVEIEKAFDERIKVVKRLPIQMIYFLYAHYLLFNDRADKFVRSGGESLGKS